MKILSKFLLFTVFVQPFLFAQTQSTEEQAFNKYSTGHFIEILKPFQSGDYAVGVLAKGKLADVVTNFGELANFHVFAPSLEWPAFGEGQDDEQQYGFGVDLMMGIKMNGNTDVIESFQDPASNLISRDWQPVDENLFSGNVTVSQTDQTPIMATSDNVDTWPTDAGGPFWPGLFRQDRFGVSYPGEFSSERDLFCIYDDSGNDTPYGIRVEQTAYTFSRRYAEDFLVYRFNIKNTSENMLQNLYPGMMIQFLVDFDNHDLINFIDSNGDGKKDLVYMWDTDMTPQEPWSKVGYIGLLAVKTPYNAGIRNFHYFHDDFTPSKDEDFWMLLASDTTGIPDTTRAKYFHGSNLRIDDVSLAPQLDPEGQNRGGEITWAFSSGPFPLAPADSMPLEIAIVCGDDEQDLLANVDWVWSLAQNNWNGPNPPNPPKVTAYPGDGEVTVVWDAQSSENSRDNLSRAKDFEGYKVYRSENRGKTWGRIITNSIGEFVGYQPIAQFDLKDGITGNDPYSNKYLGNDTGLKHTFVDTTVLNGIEYWYSVTAYDSGSVSDQIESLESALGLTTTEKNVDAAIPVKPPSNFTPGTVAGGDSSLKPVSSGRSDGNVSIEIIDSSQLKDRNYEITFQEHDTTATDTNITTFNLKDADTGELLLAHHLLTDESGDNLPLVDGFRLTVDDVEAGRKFAGWTKVENDTSTFDWYFDEHGLPNYNPAEVRGIADFKLVVTYNDSTLIRVVTVGENTIDGIEGVQLVDMVYVPIKIFDITDPNNPIDVTANTILYDFEYWGQFPPGTFGPKGWDLISEGKGYNPNALAYPDELFFISYPSDDPILPDTSIVSIRTQNKGIEPSNGDEYTIRTRKPFSNVFGTLRYTFSTTAGEYRAVNQDRLDKIRVVPNPYFVSSSFDDQIMFSNLPDKCEIRVFNVAGDLIKTIEHHGDTGATYWDLKNEAGLSIAYGLYVYVVKTDNGEKHIGKFTVVR